MDLPIHSITQEYLDQRITLDVSYRGEKEDQYSKYRTYDNEGSVLAEFTKNLEIEEKRQLYTDLLRLCEYCSTHTEHTLNSYRLKPDVPEIEISKTKAWIERYRIDANRYRLLLASLDSLESKEDEKVKNQNAIETIALLRLIGVLDCPLFKKQEYTETSKHKVLAKILGVSERTASKYYRKESDVGNKISSAEKELNNWLNELTKN